MQFIYCLLYTSFLRGVTYQQIKDKLDENNYLRDGVVELFKTLHP